MTELLISFYAGLTAAALIVGFLIPIMLGILLVGGVVGWIVEHLITSKN